MRQTIFFYLPIVSKSLLTVLGTLPTADAARALPAGNPARLLLRRRVFSMVVFILPASNDREKYRIAGSKSGPAMLGQVHPFRRPCTSSFRLPAMVLDFFPALSQRGRRSERATRLPVSASGSTLMFFRA